MDTLTKTLSDREANRIVDVVMGRDDGRSQVVHCLILTRPHGPHIGREVEQYRDIERLVVRASDCQAMADVGFGLHGAMTLTFRDGLLVSSEIIDLAPLIDAYRKHRPENRLAKVMRFERSAR